MRKKQPYQSRFREMRNWYQNHLDGNFDLKWAVIHCYFRKGLTLADTAKVLNSTTEEVESAIDIIRQDAQ